MASPVAGDPSGSHPTDCLPVWGLQLGGARLSPSEGGLRLTPARLAELNGANESLLARERARLAQGQEGRQFVRIWLHMYSDVFEVGGRMQYRATPRMEAWIAGLDHRPRAGQGHQIARKPIASLAMGDKEQTATHADKAEPIEKGSDAPTVLGLKRPATNASHEEEPATKRTHKLGRALFRSISRFGRSILKSDTKDSTAEKDDGDKDASNKENAVDREITRTNQALSRLSILDPVEPIPTGSTFTSITQTIKICLVGDTNAGKTALFNLITNRPQKIEEIKPSVTTDFRSFATLLHSKGKIIRTELYDFPGTTTQVRPHLLRSTFFHAAIICYSIEDKANVDVVSRIWKPLLDNSLVECPVFVAGLKSDTRPQHPTLELGFITKPEPVSEELGKQTAQDIKAAGWAECSSLSPDTVEFFWQGILADIVARIERGEYDLGRNRYKGRRLGQGLAALTAKCRGRGGRAG